MSNSSGEQNVYDDGVYEMLWDCKFCSTTKLLGKSQKFCPNCGAPQDPEMRYFPSDEEKVAVKDHKYEGADKTCPACGSLVAANVEYCTRCGSPQTEAAQVRLQKTRERAQNAQFATEDLDARQVEEFKVATGQVKPEAQGGLKPLHIVLGVVAVAVIGFILYTIFATREVSAYVTDYKWQRVVHVQELRAVSGSAECGREPIGAYGIDRRYEQVGSRQVKVGEECRVQQIDQGDGTFRERRVCDPVYESEPVMGYMCYYTINTWVDRQDLTSAGTKAQALEWPLTQLNSSGRCASCANSNSTACLSCQRESGRDEKYILVLKGDDDRVFECPVSYEEWESTPLETAFKLDVGRVLGGARCGSLERAR